MIAKGLREQAYAVDVAADGEAACYQASIADYGAIVLDVLLPLKDGRVPGESAGFARASSSSRFSSNAMSTQTSY